MSSIDQPEHLNFLVDQGPHLSKLLSNAKKNHEETTAERPNDVVQIVSGVMDDLKAIPPDSWTTKESKVKLVEKIGEMLDDFVKHDTVNKSEYEKVIAMVNEYRKQALDVTPSSKKSTPDPVDSSNDDNDPVEHDLESVIGKLPEKETPLLWCFLLFPDKAEIKKREIIHCWVGIDSMDSTAGERLLAKFVAVGLIERTFKNKKLLNRYKMPTNVRRHLKSLHETNEAIQVVEDEELDQKSKQSETTPSKEDVKDTKIEHKDKRTWGTLRLPDGGASKKLLQRAATMITNAVNPAGMVNENVDASVLLNVDQSTLSATRFKTISAMNRLRVAHLGSWHQDATKYIVVEDVEAFKDLRNLSKVKFLSLEGVSGMVELPKHVYELRELLVLDLRGCNNLEHFPKGIDSLVKLTHLDLSGCYLLDHVPLGIRTLINLQVLKGFIINREEPQVEDNAKGKGKRNQEKTEKETEKEKEKEKKNRKDNEKEKGTRGKKSRAAPSLPCPFIELQKLTQLRKLTILTRRMAFPTPTDFLTFSKLERLTSLRITWVMSNLTGTSTNEVSVEGAIFPATLTKLELQAASHETASRLLRLISEDKSRCGLEKLYLRGGGLKELKYSFPQPTEVRLRYLPDLQIDWDDFKKLFPNLERLDVLNCPNLILFPCDKNGIWEHSQSIIDDGESKVKIEDDENKEIPRNHEIESSTSSEIVASLSN